MNQERRVIVIGLDAADHVLMERWADEGALPNFAKLLKEGAYGILDSTAEVFSGSAWISVATGCGPGRCGVYSRYQLNSGTYDVGRVKASDCRVKPFWTSFKGPIVAVDVPKMPLVPQPGGFQVVEWGAYDHYSEFSTYPAGLAKRIVDEFGDHPFMDDNFEVELHKRRDFAKLRALLIKGVGMKQRLSADLIKRVRPRFMLSAFGETHAAGHAFWRFQDPRHPSYEPGGSYHTALRDIYRAIDDAIGEILRELPRNCILAVLSSQGFCLDSMADEDFLQEILTRTKLSVPRLAMTKYAAYTPGLTLDMTRSKAFGLPTDLQGYIRLNLKGREPKGWISEGEYDVVCQEIESELLALRHDDLDVPVVKEVVRVRDRLKGPFLDALPDLSIIWNCDRVVSQVRSPTCGRLACTPDLSAGGGNHRGVGFALIYGCGVRQGRFAGNVFDMAPTIASWLNEQSRPEWEGHILNITGLEESNR